MGCDIHTMIEIKLSGSDQWVCYGDLDYEIGRHYELFAALAGVRNDYGIKPISKPRGIPDDACKEYKSLVENWDLDGHSHSWVTVEDLETLDLDQEFDDKRVVLGRGADGKITAVAASTTGPHLGKVGKRKLFELWGLERFEMIHDKLYSLSYGQEVRLVFFFDN